MSRANQRRMMTETRPSVYNRYKQCQKVRFFSYAWKYWTVQRNDSEFQTEGALTLKALADSESAIRGTLHTTQLRRNKTERRRAELKATICIPIMTWIDWQRCAGWRGWKSDKITDVNKRRTTLIRFGGRETKAGCAVQKYFFKSPLSPTVLFIGFKQETTLLSFWKSVTVRPVRLMNVCGSVSRIFCRNRWPPRDACCRFRHLPSPLIIYLAVISAKISWFMCRTAQQYDVTVAKQLLFCNEIFISRFNRLSVSSVFYPYRISGRIAVCKIMAKK